MKNLKITPLRTPKERFYHEFSKHLVTWNETEAGPEDDSRLLDDIYDLFEKHKEDIKYLDSRVFKDISEFFKS